MNNFNIKKIAFFAVLLTVCLSQIQNLQTIESASNFQTTTINIVDGQKPPQSIPANSKPK